MVHLQQIIKKVAWKDLLVSILIASVFPFSAASVSSLPAHAQASRSASELSKGKFLVASREIKDPRFAETVILLLDYDVNGAIGLVVNRQTDVKLSKLLPNITGLKRLPDTAYVGGPVSEGSVLLLLRDKKRRPELLRVFEDVYVTASLSELKKIIGDDGLRYNFRAYVGYAGWSAGQLEREVSMGQWHIIQADAAMIFNKRPSGVWRELIEKATARWVKNIREEKENQM